MNTLELQELYKRMLTIRLLEDRLQAYCDRGEAGDLHFNKGQEAIAVGVCSVLKKEDHIVTHHRTIAHQIAKGADLYPLVAELLGKRTGKNGGRAGEMHISDREIRHDFSFQLVGTCIPVAAGLAWALKNYRKVDEMVAVFFGDACTSNGQFHEAMSIAAIHKLPLLLVCENNHLAGNIRPNHFMPVDTIVERVRGYGIPARAADGNNIEEVVSTTSQALEIMRRGNGPYLIEFDTTRLCWHKQGQRDVRPLEELAELAKRDPLAWAEKRMPELDNLTLIHEINSKLDDAFARADADPPPEVYID